MREGGSASRDVVRLKNGYVCVTNRVRCDVMSSPYRRHQYSSTLEGKQGCGSYLLRTCVRTCVCLCGKRLEVQQVKSCSTYLLSSYTPAFLPSCEKEKELNREIDSLIY